MNSVLSNFNFLSADSRIRIFNTNCTSYYGSQLINLQNRQLEKLNVAWRVSSRRILNVDCRTHSDLLPPLMSSSPPGTDISCRIASFFKSGIAHPCYIVSFFFYNCLILKNTIMYKNLSVISREAGIGISCFGNSNVRTSHIKKRIKLKNIYEQPWKINLIKALIDIKEHSAQSVLDMNEIAFTLNFLCTQ